MPGFIGTGISINAWNEIPNASAGTCGSMQGVQTFQAKQVVPLMEMLAN